MKFLISILLSVCLFAQVCYAEEMNESLILPLTTASDITMITGLPLNAKLKSVLYSSSGEIYVGLKDEKGLSLYSWPFPLQKEAPVLTSPLLSMNDVTCHDLEEYDGNRIAMLCTEHQNDVFWSSIYIVSKETVEKVLSQTNQIFSLCSYNNDIAYAYLDEQDNAHVACMDSVGKLKWDVRLDSRIIFSHLIASNEGVFCAGYYNATYDSLYTAMVAQISPDGQLLWLHQTNQHVYISDAVVVQGNRLVIIGDLNEYDYEGYYIGCFNAAGMVWEQTRPVPHSTTVTTCIHVNDDQITFAHRKLRERKAATLVTMDYQGRIVDESKISFEGVNMPTVRIVASHNNTQLFVVTGVNQAAEDTIHIIYGKGLWLKPEPGRVTSY